MKNSSFLWRLQGALQELANQLEIAKKDKDWQKVDAISKVILKNVERIDKQANICYDKQD